MSTSVGGVLTGRGADWIILDDLLKPIDALSETPRAAVNEFFRHTLYSRLNDKRKGVVIIIMQRLHEDDLVGYVLKETKEPWTVLSFPAVAERDEIYTFETPAGQRTVTRKAGEALHPEREDLETLKCIRETIGEYNFAAQYQQSPSPLGGGMVKASWFQTYAAHALPGPFELIIHSWDTANKTNELADFSVCTTWGLYQKKLYLLDVYRGRLDYPALKRAVRDRNSARPGLNLIEDKSSGTPLIQELSHEGVSIQPYRSNLDKVMRMHSTSGMIENGLVFLPEKAEWRNEFLHELTIFPKGRYDDQVDSVSQCLDWIRQYQNRRRWYVSDAFTGKLIAEY